MALRKLVYITLLVFLFLVLKISTLNLKDITFANKGKLTRILKSSTSYLKDSTSFSEEQQAPNLKKNQSNFNGSSSFNKGRQIQSIQIFSIHSEDDRFFKEEQQLVTALNATEYLESNNSLHIEKLYEISIDSLGKVFEDTVMARAGIIERIEHFSEISLGTPYVLSSLGEGSCGQYDNDPIVDLSRVDCMTFCEQILAISISYDYDEFINILQKIRYHSEIVSIKTRNHFVVADWLFNNNWLVDDVTEDVAENFCREMTKTINRHQLLLNLGCKDTTNVPNSQTLTIPYIPKEHLLKISHNLKSGDIACIITKKRGIFVSHMGFIIKNEKDQILFRNANKFARKVINEPYDKLVYRLMRQQSTAGITIIRAKVNFTMTNVTVLE